MHVVFKVGPSEGDGVGAGVGAKMKEFFFNFCTNLQKNYIDKLPLVGAGVGALSIIK